MDSYHIHEILEEVGLAGMKHTDVLLKVKLLLSLAWAVGALELGQLAALVLDVSVQRGAVSVGAAAAVAAGRRVVPVEVHHLAVQCQRVLGRVCKQPSVAVSRG